MTQREAGILLVRFAGLCLVAYALVGFAHYFVRGPLDGTLVGLPATMPNQKDVMDVARQQMESTWNLAGAFDVGILAFGLYCLLGGGVVANLLCRPCVATRAA